MLGHFPTRGTERVSGFALQIGNGPEHFSRDRGNDRQNHDGEDDSGGEHPDAENRPLEQRQKSEHLLDRRIDARAQDGHQDEKAPQSPDHAGHGGEHFNDGSQRLAQLHRGEVGEVNGGSNPSGTAIRSAIRDETRVPKINGSAPNSSVTGFQRELVKNFQAEFLQRKVRAFQQLPENQQKQ